MLVKDFVKYLETLPQEAEIEISIDTWTPEEGEFTASARDIESHEIIYNGTYVSLKLGY